MYRLCTGCTSLSGRTSLTSTWQASPLLSVAYVAPLDKGRALVVAAVCALAVLASVAAYFQDKNLRGPMELAEKALCGLQEKLAGPQFDLHAVKIQSAIEASKGSGECRVGCRSGCSMA
jgi:hypothetical protein